MVIETHQVQGRSPVTLIYYAPSGFNPATQTTPRATAMNAQLQDEEAETNFNRDAAPLTAELTMTEFLQRVRQVYQSSTRADTCRIAWWLLRRIAQGHITDAQCQTAFNRTAPQWTNFKANTLTPQADAWAALLAATGS
jgi:hypothetical protein